ncbi:MipA/OmpV family protein [Thalassotalea sp. G2M2-11]|uniref:MipA/OmpV family protein n=1 Tax=Thalassotalea sp. G2M2-11 TaxID=2787627 RepID=UPI0019D062AD|nr:MipA/OmpV family protein [Thalassotalea sp. G2M2-11]
MKIALTIALLACSSVVYGATDKQVSVKTAKQLTDNVHSQWGVQALKFPKHTQLNSAESLGLTLPSNSNTSTNIDHFNGLNASYSYGNFSATTGVLTQSTNISETSQLYLQGAYHFFGTERFSLALSAKIEAVDNDTVNRYYGYKDNFRHTHAGLNQLATNTTLELVSTYNITPKWKVHGVISTTTLDSKIENSPLINDDNIQMALIKTSYSF